MRQFTCDVPVLPVLAVALAFAAALLAPARHALWAMAALMWLHMMAHCRSTPLLVTIVAPAVFAPAEGAWPADCVLAAAAYVVFYICYELEPQGAISPPEDAVSEGHRAGDGPVAI